MTGPHSVTGCGSFLPTDEYEASPSGKSTASPHTRFTGVRGPAPPPEASPEATSPAVPPEAPCETDAVPGGGRPGSRPNAHLADHPAGPSLP